MERLQHHYQALGSEVYITLVGHREQVWPLFKRLHARITRFEQRFSRFLPASELSIFNTSAGARTEISPEFHKLLVASRKLSEQTNGLYNPFILPALQKIGYAGSWPNPSAKPAIDFSTRHVSAIEALEIGDTWAHIPEDSALDFGGIGKGYLLDELGVLLKEQGQDNFWISLGGDILCSGHDIEDRPWHVAVQDAIDPDKHIDTIQNEKGTMLAIATSGITKRRGFKNNQAWHHIIDPRTGKSADTDILTVTTTAETAVHADVCAKCIIIGGTRVGQTYQKQGLIKTFLVQAAQPDEQTNPTHKGTS